MKLFPIRLLATAMINGKPRSPAEGIQMVNKADRDRLVDETKQAEDADADVENADAGDELDKKKGAPLRKIATAENVTVAEDADDEAVRAAIRQARAAQA